MKVPLSWLKDFVDINLSPIEIARKLTMIGLEVEEIRLVGVALRKMEPRKNSRSPGLPGIRIRSWWLKSTK